MSRESYRSIGAIFGLAIGFALMKLAGQSEIVPGAIFGAGGALAGGIIGERVHTLRNRK